MAATAATKCSPFLDPIHLPHLLETYKLYKIMNWIKALFTLCPLCRATMWNRQKRSSNSAESMLKSSGGMTQTMLPPVCYLFTISGVCLTLAHQTLFPGRVFLWAGQSQEKSSTLLKKQGQMVSQYHSEDVQVKQAVEPLGFNLQRQPLSLRSPAALTLC